MRARPKRPFPNLAAYLSLPVIIAAALGSYAVITAAGNGNSPHLDPTYGVNRLSSPLAPIGSCKQCHDMHALQTGESPYPKALFTENTNLLCYTSDGAGPCHQARPSNYPADENSRIPEGFPDAGYFEYNSGGNKIHGAQYRNRWPGAAVYDNPGIATGFHYYSPHRNDPDMPIIDDYNQGSCLNCHNPHGTQNPFDMLVSTYRGIGGFDEPTTPSNYTLCFDCHSSSGPSGMEQSSRLIEDYYNSAVNNDNRAGHQIRMDNDIAISWPSHIRAGDKLPCYDCHNPHGSEGYNGSGPNAFLISDERPGWANLTDTLNDPAQNRRFCLGCHIPADGVPGSIVVEGIVMNTLPNKREHKSTATKACGDCHGASYSSSTSYNVHHPKGHG
jgi:hypothetical protein